MEKGRVPNEARMAARKLAEDRKTNTNTKDSVKQLMREYKLSRSQAVNVFRNQRIALKQYLPEKKHVKKPRGKRSPDAGGDKRESRELRREARNKRKEKAGRKGD